MAAFVQSYGLQLLDHGGKPYDAQQLTSSDVIAFYFSAHWCPPCRQFTPMLKKFVETLKANGEHSLKIIFVSSDKAEHEMWKYVYDCHGDDWLNLAYSCTDVKDRLSRQYQVSGIPNLVVIDGVGRQVVRNGTGEVMAAATSSTQVLTTYLAWKTASGAGPTIAPCDQLPNDSRVRIRGLTGAPQHNGTVGTVRSYDKSKSRYVVDLGGESSLSLRGANLLQLLPVQILAEEDKEEFSDAVIEDFDVDSGEFTMRLVQGDADASMNDEATVVRAKIGDRAAPRFQAGARLVVQGLQSESGKQWNDKLSKVVSFDEDKKRYLMQVSHTAQLQIRPENLRLSPL